MELVDFWNTAGSKWVLNPEKVKGIISPIITNEQIKGRDVLDVGCGNGIFSIVFGQTGAKKVIGIDISVESLEVAKQIKKKYNLGNVDFKLGDISHLPFSSNSFDIIWAWGSVHYTEDPLRCIEELADLLRPKGMLIISTIRRTPQTFVYERLRRVLSKTPKKWQAFLSKTLSICLYPLAIFSRKKVKPLTGKTLYQKIYEWLFSPTQIRAYKFKQINDLLSHKNLLLEEVVLPNSDIYNLQTGLVIKGIKL